MGRKKRKKSQNGLWYHQGLRFECTQCGACCTGRPGSVEFTPEEGEAMAEELGMDEEEFYFRYAKPGYAPGTWLLGEVETEFGFDCLLLKRCDETGKTWCTAHSARPTQCRTWPFWPENLRSPRVWNRVARDCEGIGRGDYVPLKVIQEQARFTPPGICHQPGDS